MGSDVNDKRLEKIKSILNKRGVRFPLATIVKDLQVDGSLVSSYLNGKKPISDKFYNKFLDFYGEEGENDIIAINQDLSKTIGLLVEEIARLRSEVVVLNQTVDLLLHGQTGQPLSIVTATRIQAVEMQATHILAALRKQLK